jgi:virginiamycin B lyase
MPNIIEHEISYLDSHPYILTFGPDGGLWFCDNGAGQICRMDVSTGMFGAFPLPRRDCQPVGIITGHNGHLWFTEYAGHTVGRITVDGEITEFDLPTLSAGPTGIIDGPDGKIWFAETDAGQMAQISTHGIVLEETSGIPQSRAL